MAWVATAIAGSAVVGAISSSRAASKAASAQDRATESAEAMQAEQLAFERERYEDWQAVFGDVQTQLGEYYTMLDSETIEAIGLQAIEQDYAAGAERLQKTLAQRGITGSGIEAAGLTQLEMGAATGKAAVRASAEDEAMRKKQSFLGMGLGLERSAAAGVSGALGSQAAYQAQQAAAYGNLSQQAAAGVGQSIGGGISSYMQYQQMQNQQKFQQGLLSQFGTGQEVYVGGGGATWGTL